MHISEGVLSAPVLAGGAALALPALGWSLKRLPWDHIMSTGILSAAFFTASLIHIPIGPGSVHLILNGVLGAVLGPAAFPAVAAALLLQALLFNFGGLSTLGVNLCIMAGPAVLCGTVCRPFFRTDCKVWAAAAFACGAGAVLFSALLCALALSLSGEVFRSAAGVIFLAHLPIMLIEGFLSMGIIGYLRKTMPELPAATRPERDHADDL
ncbi:MAG: cobalt transporter CbiM [Desulfovibrio sp.]|jgi:cobalt/nickel transport system permease protein|nr:cobalt transporter CbiM [Desulfovibrio sp.]